MWITRPQQAAAEFATLLEKQGIAAYIEPLLQITFPALEAAQYQYIQNAATFIFTSKQAVKALAEKENFKENFSRRCFVCVGQTTYDAAIAEGLQPLASYAPDSAALVLIIQNLLQQQQLPLPLLYCRGRNIYADILPEIQKNMLFPEKAQQVCVYQAEAVPQLSTTFLTIAPQLQGVVLFSKRTANIYITLMQQLGFFESIKQKQHFCLSAAVAQPLQTQKIHKSYIKISPSPDVKALLGCVHSHVFRSCL